MRISIILGTFFLMSAAFFNGYPLVYSDTATYLESGFEVAPPFDRPITYGLFIRLTSLNGISLWLVIFAQAVILSYLVFLFIREFSDLRKDAINLAIIAFLSFFTGLSWTTGQLIADVFTPIMALCMTILIFGNPSKRERWLLYFFFTLSCASHISHINFNFVMLSGVLILSAIKAISTPEIKRTFILLFLTLLSILPMLVAISKSKHVFLMGAMVEHGIVKKYLDEHCEERHFKLCAYKDVLPQKAWDFIWNKDSPLNITGGWKANKDEYNQIIYGTLTEPKYLFMNVQESLKATFAQLLRFRIADGNGIFLEGTVLYKRINKYFPHEVKQYSKSGQNKGCFLQADKANFVYLIITIASILLLSFVLFKGAFKGNQRGAVAFLLTGILINAWVCGTFSTAVDRYGCEMMWLVPFVSMLGLFSYISKPRPATV